MTGDDCWSDLGVPFDIDSLVKLFAVLVPERIHSPCQCQVASDRALLLWHCLKLTYLLGLSCIEVYDVARP